MRETVVGTLSGLGIQDPASITEAYFARLEEVAQRLAGKSWEAAVLKAPDDPDWRTWINWASSGIHKHRRLERFLSSVSLHQDDVTRITARTSSFLELMSSFLGDSHKTIEFATSGDLVVRRRRGEAFGASQLSSGELQLLTLFTFLYFEFDLNQEFAIVIDEPELSLHPAWQTRYLDSISSANPNAQFILATHSPEMVGPYEDRCIDLSLET